MIYSKPGCHLCEDAAAQLQKLQQAHRFELREVNILSDPATFEKFKYEIPVVFIDGQESSRRYFDARQFLERLTDN
ncbi:MAG TPA: glutaredoxin family protein [Terriglobia bacterium]|nr:glutaredoxin family protein [Terriglobia bacterium]